ncbi:MAG: spermidine synthase [Planctomycetota bacterium]
MTKILAAADTEWQAMQIVETGAYGRGLVLDGKWQSCTGDEFLYHEPLVHPACLSFTEITGRPPRSLLILGGGEGATLREALRWPSIERATMVDIDGEVVEACKTHLPEMHRGAFEDARAELVIGDALAYVADDATKPKSADGDGWDVIISDLSDPIEDGPSYQLFTQEYFASLKSILSDGGVLAVQSGPVNPPELVLHARLRTTLDSLFAKTASIVSCVPTYPSPWSFILAGDERLTELVDAERVDALLAQHVRPFGGTELRMFDGVACRGVYSVPKHLRNAIDAETVVYTKDNPPKFFGSGNVG